MLLAVTQRALLVWVFPLVSTNLKRPPTWVHDWLWLKWPCLSRGCYGTQSHVQS